MQAGDAPDHHGKKGSSADVARCCAAPLKSKKITVRSMTAEDLPEAAQVCQEAFTAFNSSVCIPLEFPPVEVANIPEALLGQGLQKGFEAFVAVDENGKIVGSNCIEMRDEVAGIGPISVATGSANDGVGKLLMQAVMQAAEKKGKKVVRLHQICPNVKSYSLYLSCGFDPLVTCGHYEGVCTASAPEGFTFADLAEEHVDGVSGCDQLHKCVYGYSRRNDLLAMVPHPAPGGVVKNSQGKVVAYTTGCFLSGHSVAETFEAFQFLVVNMSKKIEEVRAAGAPFPPCTFFVPHNYPEVARWLSRNGLKLIRQVVQMGYGPHQPTKNGYYMPAIQY